MQDSQAFTLSTRGSTIPGCSATFRSAWARAYGRHPVSTSRSRSLQRLSAPSRTSWIDAVAGMNPMNGRRSYRPAPFGQGRMAGGNHIRRERMRGGARAAPTSLRRLQMPAATFPGRPRSSGEWRLTADFPPPAVRSSQRPRRSGPSASPQVAGFLKTNGLS